MTEPRFGWFVVRGPAVKDEPCAMICMPVEPKGQGGAMCTAFVGAQGLQAWEAIDRDVRAVLKQEAL